MRVDRAVVGGTGAVVDGVDVEEADADAEIGDDDEKLAVERMVVEIDRTNISPRTHLTSGMMALEETSLRSASSQYRSLMVVFPVGPCSHR